MDMRPSGASSRSHERNRIAALHGLANCDQGALVVGIAGDITVAMIDLHEIAIPGAVARPGHNPRGHGDHVRALGAREIDSLVIGLLAGEWILALAKIGGNEAAGDRAPLRMGLL